MHSYLATEFKFYKINIRGKKNDWLKNPLLEKKLHKIRNLRLLNKLPITLCNFQPSFSNTRRDDLLFSKVNLIHDTVTL